MRDWNSVNHCVNCTKEIFENKRITVIRGAAAGRAPTQAFISGLEFLKAKNRDFAEKISVCRS